jgi:hypothetical protein
MAVVLNLGSRRERGHDAHADTDNVLDLRLSAERNHVIRGTTSVISRERQHDGRVSHAQSCRPIEPFLRDGGRSRYPS